MIILYIRRQYKRGMTDRFWRLAQELIVDADIILHVLDARWGTWTLSEKVVKLCEMHSKPLIYVFNKCDLLSKREALRLKKKLQPSVIFSSKNHFGLRDLRAAMGIASSKMHKKEVKIGVVGYPNTGKSSVINALKGRHSAPASSRSGTTKGLQLIRISQNILLVDSPGVLPLQDIPEHQLALLDSTNPDHLKDPITVACSLLELMIEQYGETWLYEQFGVVYAGEIDEDLLEDIAKMKNRLRSGGRGDATLIAKQIVQQWQKGELVGGS